MIFYYDFDELKSKQYDSILKELNDKYEQQNAEYQVVLCCLNSINNTILSDNASKIKDIKSLISLLEKFKNISDELKSNRKNINSLIFFFKSIITSGKPYTQLNIAELNKYNDMAKNLELKLTKQQKDYEDFIMEYAKHGMSIEIESPIVNALDESLNTQSSNSVAVNSNIPDSNTLLISEKLGKVILPFSKNELVERLQCCSNYSNIEDLIEKEYTIPLAKYKNPVASRFAEAYALMKKKEKATVLESLDLALEVAFNRSLNPAVITACKNLDELDEYLDCIDKNDFKQFKAFNVKFDVSPFKT